MSVVPLMVDHGCGTSLSSQLGFLPTLQSLHHTISSMLISHMLFCISVPLFAQRQAHEQCGCHCMQWAQPESVVKIDMFRVTVLQL